MVKQAGGAVEVRSGVGKGTTFEVYLPACGEAPAEAPEAAGAGEPESPGGRETILLVEDERNVRDLCARILGECGYRVLRAADGIEALALCRGGGERIDLLVTDVVMPGMNGKELSNRLLALQPGLKVLFMSGYTDDAIVSHGVLEEGVSFIGKPYSPSALARKVRDVLDGK